MNTITSFDNIIGIKNNNTGSRHGKRQRGVTESTLVGMCPKCNMMINFNDARHGENEVLFTCPRCEENTIKFDSITVDIYNDHLKQKEQQAKVIATIEDTTKIVNKINSELKVITLL